MAPRIALSLAIHNHQPVGNFGWVFGEVYDQAYLPMLEALERHHGIRLSLHYTGPLLEWLAAERPEFLERLGALIHAGRVELLGGGLYEPILASLPEHDRIDQLTRMATVVEGLTGRRPKGAWLAERVWEPDLPTSLVSAGYEWTILDDQHFRAAAIHEEDLWGAYTTEDQGCLLRVFGTEQGLRYRIPFGTVESVIDYLRDHATDAGDRLGTMGDDGEKFGAWPTTYAHCWGEGRWVDRFFDALETNAGWLTTVTPSQWLKRQPPIGRVYVPTSSYAEMGEWALPAGEGVVFHRVLRDAVARHEPDARWLRGGFWRNFQVKYREINDLHKQMLRTSAKVARMPAGADKASAQDHLHRGQSNDCYWHGLFGGIYIPHMRMATLEHLIAAEDAADTALGSQSAAGLADLDMDGRDEALLEAPGQVVTVKPAEGAGIASWDLRAARHGVASVMRRRPEAYHQALRAHDAKAAALAAEPGEGDGGATSIHDIVMTKEAHLSEYLHYDDHERRSALVRFLDPTATPEQYAVASEREVADFRDGEFAVDRLEQSLLSLSRAGNVLGQPVELTKTIRLSGGRMDPELTVELEVRHRGTQPVDARLGVELGVNLLGGGGNPDAWYEVDGARSRHDGAGTAEAMDAIRYGNDWAGVAITARAEPAADVWWSPIETVSNSESGFERVYQGSALLLSWLVRLEPGSVHHWSVCQSAAVARDKAAAERAARA